MSLTSMPMSLRLLGLYPKKLGSACVGVGARFKLSPKARRNLLGRFAAAYGVNLDEAEKPLEEYESFLDFFTRRLKPGLRPQAPLGKGGLNSPVDGALIAKGPIDDGTLIQAKGLPYRLDELMPDEELVARFEKGQFVTLYLSPKDYHRIHVPIEGRCLAIGRIEGELWPVNEASTAFTKRLYVRNRRAYWIAEGTGADAGLTVAVVMVAATHVGGVKIAPRWLGGRTLPNRGRLRVPMLPCTPGEDLGVFELGSTVVMVIGGPDAERWVLERGEGAIRLGERLGGRRVEP
ncbi:MAG: archaetidylserine decarboxylase [Thermoanaerobaculia bacterium]